MTRNLSPKQLMSIAKSDQRVNIWEGSISSGKTFSSIIRWLTFVANAPENGELMMIGKNRDSIYRNVFAPIENEPALSFLTEQVSYRNGAPTGLILGRRVNVIGANDNRAEAKIRGSTVAGAYVDELTVLPHEFFKQLLGRMRVAGAQLFATTNPDSPAHWLNAEYFSRIGVQLPDGTNDLPDWRRFHFMMEDNPALEQSYIDSVKREYTGLWYQRFIEGLWVSADGAIYDMWEPDRHIVRWEDMPEMQMVLGVGVDHGTTNPTVGIMLGLGVDGNLYAMDEWRHETGKSEARWSNVQQSAGMREWLASKHHPKQDGLGHGFVCVDPAAADFHVQLRQDGVRTNMAENDVLYGIRTTASLLSSARLRVSDRCAGLLKELPAYTWSEKASLEGKDQPNKVNDHSCFVAGTLVTTARGFVPIEEVLPGDIALTRDGWHEITEAGMSDTDAETFDLALSTGETITGTANHPFWVEGQGFIALGHLANGALLHAETGEITVTSVEPTGRREPVYNITVVGQPEYFANGVLVHNCDALRYAIATTERKWRKYIQMNQPVQNAA